MRRAAAGLLLAATLAAAPSCKGSTPTLQGTIERIGAQFDQMLGAQSLPGKYVAEIYAVHEDDRGWRFRADADDALERTREAVRGLASADYGSWRETGIVVAMLATMAEDHPSSLVRAECLDALTRMSGWTAAAVPATERAVTEDEVLDALHTIGEARKRAADDAGAPADVADALNTVAAYRFDRARPLPETVDRALLARGSRTQLTTARGILRALTGGALDGVDADPRVRDALDRALVATSAAASRLALVSAAVSGPNDVVRGTAVRDLGVARPEQAARMLGAVLRGDESTSVRREAVRALGGFAEAEAVPELLPALTDDRFEVRGAAAAALAQCTGQAFGDDRTAWTNWWKDRDGAARPR